MQNNDFIEGSNDEPNYNADPPIEMEAIDVNFSYDGFQVVRGEFFAHIYEPSITFNKRKVYLNTACIKKFPEIDYVQILVNSEEKKLKIGTTQANSSLRKGFILGTSHGGKE